MSISELRNKVNATLPCGLDTICSWSATGQRKLGKENRRVRSLRGR